MLNSIWEDPKVYSDLRKCWLNVRREQFILERIKSLRDGECVLDVGSGTGNLLSALAVKFPKITFVGLEPSKSYVEFATSEAKAKAIGNVTYVEGFGEEADKILTGPFHLILSNDVIHHVQCQKSLSKSLCKLTPPNATWLAIEPNAFNPYTFIRQASGVGEKNFYKSRFLEDAPDWSLQRKDYLFLIPPFIKDPPAWLKTIEPHFEKIPFLAGGIALTMTRNHEQADSKI